MLDKLSVSIVHLSMQRYVLNFSETSNDVGSSYFQH